MNKREIDNLDKDRLLEAAKSGDFISSIYNYCDRWCEKCKFTEKCLNFRMIDNKIKSQNSNGNTNEPINNIEDSLKLAMELIQDITKELNVKINDSEEKEIQNEQKRIDTKIKENSIIRQCRRYSKAVNDFLNDNSLYFGKILGCEILSGDDSISKEKEAVEIIMWYNYMIEVKFARTLHGYYSKLDEEDDNYDYDDKLVSARITIYSIDRLMAAWYFIYTTYSTYEENAKDFLVMLAKIKNEIEQFIPEVVAYKRPYFD